MSNEAQGLVKVLPATATVLAAVGQVLEIIHGCRGKITEIDVVFSSPVDAELPHRPFRQTQNVEAMGSYLPLPTGTQKDIFTRHFSMKLVLAQYGPRQDWFLDIEPETINLLYIHAVDEKDKSYHVEWRTHNRYDFDAWIIESEHRQTPDAMWMVGTCHSNHRRCRRDPHYR